MLNLNLQMVFLVGAAGFLGTVLRYVSGVWVASYFSFSGLNTLIVNFLGSLAIGCIYGLGSEKIDPQTATIITVGLLGGFTTFSAFSAETILYLKEGRWFYACGYVFVMLACGLFATYLGMMSTKS